MYIGKVLLWNINFSKRLKYRRSLSTIREWNESEIITDRKSRFQARHVQINDPSEVTPALDQFVFQHKSIVKNASHPHIIAWRTGIPESEPIPKSEYSIQDKNRSSFWNRSTSMCSGTTRFTNVQQGYKDNGEKGAGSRLLEQVLVNNNIYNVLVIVTRWYGGNPIGSLRFRHIVNSSLNSLRKGNRLENR